MKTIRILNLGNAGHAAQFDHIRSLNPALPEAVQNDRVMQFFLSQQFGGADAGYGLYETSEDSLGRAIEATDPVGTIEVRVDYVPNDKEDNIVFVVERALWAVAKPYCHDLNPADGVFESVRVSVMVAPETILTQTFWPAYGSTKAQQTTLDKLYAVAEQ